MAQTEREDLVESKLTRKQLKRMARQVKQLDSEVHQAMAVMYAETGKILN